MTAQNFAKKRLPPELRSELDKLILADDFGTINDLVDWLKARGHSISHSAMHRYIQVIRAEFSKTLQAFSLSARAEPSTLGDGALLRELGELYVWRTQIDRRMAALAKALESRHAATMGAP